MKNSNFILLGVAVAYIVIAIIQGSADGTLSANIYVTVAFLSLELTILEAIKSITNLLSNNIIMQYSINENCNNQVVLNLLNIDIDVRGTSPYLLIRCLRCNYFRR